MQTNSMASPFLSMIQEMLKPLDPKEIRGLAEQIFPELRQISDSASLEQRASLRSQLRQASIICASSGFISLRTSTASLYAIICNVNCLKPSVITLRTFVSRGFTEYLQTKTCYVSRSSICLWHGKDTTRTKYVPIKVR